ncbi:MAG: PhzF family phenazine biosynthesis protein [Myxococcota bacterium]|nr:PhzF family phenazine biosynthesis protein [Myxococcota bacterium]
MQLKLFVVDAFTRALFGGNPAAVVPLQRWLPDPLLQSIAAENNLSETAFFVPEGDGFHLRWMTPVREVTFCGHATIATSFVILNLLQPGRDEVRYRTLCGELTVRRNGDLLAMEAPNWEPSLVPPPPLLISALGRTPREVLAARDYLAVFETEEEIRALTPDMAGLMKLDRDGVIVTAPGTRSDFVSRYFGPQVGIPEDPATGSAHSTLAPYWARRLGKSRLHALQLSSRVGELFCEVRGDRVITSGRAVKYLEGTLDLPPSLLAP